MIHLTRSAPPAGAGEPNFGKTLREWIYGALLSAAAGAFIAGVLIYGICEDGAAHDAWRASHPIISDNR